MAIQVVPVRVIRRWQGCRYYPGEVIGLPPLEARDRIQQGFAVFHRKEHSETPPGDLESSGLSELDISRLRAVGYTDQAQVLELSMADLAAAHVDAVAVRKWQEQTHMRHAAEEALAAGGEGVPITLADLRGVGAAKVAKLADAGVEDLEALLLLTEEDAETAGLSWTSVQGWQEEARRGAE